MIKQAFGILVLILAVSSIFWLRYLPIESRTPVEIEQLGLDGSPVAILYFGYTGCVDSCPVTMQLLADMYRDDLTEPRPHFLFINLNLDEDAQSTQLFAEFFDPHFQGILPSNTELERLRALFGLNFRKVGSEGQIVHQGRVYLLQRMNRSWYIREALNEVSLSRENVSKEIRLLLRETYQ